MGEEWIQLTFLIYVSNKLFFSGTFKILQLLRWSTLRANNCPSKDRHGIHIDRWTPILIGKIYNSKLRSEEQKKREWVDKWVLIKSDLSQSSFYIKASTRLHQVGPGWNWGIGECIVQERLRNGRWMEARTVVMMTCLCSTLHCRNVKCQLVVRVPVNYASWMPSSIGSYRWIPQIHSSALNIVMDYNCSYCTSEEPKQCREG